MNPELFKIALENKAIVDAYKSQLIIQNAAVPLNTNLAKHNNVFLKIILLTGVFLIGYTIYRNNLARAEKN
jgi:hypothetical protein